MTLTDPPGAGPVLGRARALLRWLPDTWRELDEAREPGPAFGRFEAGLLVVAALGLSIMYFFGQELYFLTWFGDWLTPPPGEGLPGRMGPRGHPYYELLGLSHWVVFCVVGYVLLPMAYLRLTGRRIRSYYLSWRGTLRHLHVYAILYVLVILPVVIVSYTPEYQQIYPFYTRSARSWFDLVAWELAYGLQFFALEFFFRGFMLEGLRKRLGSGAIFVMIVPYCMLHFQKTLSESLGAIVAGVVLGTMAMRWRSIWGGVLLHWLVAISMDVASLVQQGRFPPGRF